MLTDSVTSYILDFTPDGCMVGKDRNVTDKIDNKGGGNIISMIKFLVQPSLENMKYFAEKRNIL